MRPVYLAIGLATALTVVPASWAQGSRVPDQGQSAGTGTGSSEAQPPYKPGSNTGISLEVPIGRVSVDPELGGEPVYVRRTTAKEGMTVVEVSTTPFTPDLPAGAQLTVRPDQPAGW